MKDYVNYSVNQVKSEVVELKNWGAYIVLDNFIDTRKAYQNSKEYKQTLDKLEDLNSQFKDAMKELGEGFKELGKIKV